MGQSCHTCERNQAFGADDRSSVLSFGDLEVQGRAFAVDDYRSGIEQLLASAVVTGEAPHHAEGEEELHGFGLRSIAEMDRTAEVHSVEANILREEVQRGPYEMRYVFVEGQGCEFVARASGRGVKRRLKR